MTADESSLTLRSVAVLVVGRAILCGLALPKLLSVYRFITCRLATLP
jgi:hypothetical protein